MDCREEFTTAWAEWQLLTFYQRFEHAVILFLSGLISVVVVMAVWNLLLKVVASVMLSGGFDPTDYSVFQSLFGMIFTVIIALEFKRSLLVVAERRHSVVQVRTCCPDRTALRRAKADDHRSVCNRCRASVRSFGCHPRAWRRILARAPPGPV